MDNEVVGVEVTHHNVDDDPGSISGSLRYSSKKHRREILASHGYHELWLGEVSREKYAELLCTHYWIRKTIEDCFSNIGNQFIVANQFFDEKKVFPTDDYLVARHIKSIELGKDFHELTGRDVTENQPESRAKALINYIGKIDQQYPVALLGIAYMLEEVQCYAGPRIGLVVNKKLDLKGKATSYLTGNGNEKKALWQFRKSLDLITDFQTQANIVIASTLSYRMYRDYIDPYAVLMLEAAGKFND